MPRLPLVVATVASACAVAIAPPPEASAPALPPYTKRLPPVRVIVMPVPAETVALALAV